MFFISSTDYQLLCNISWMFVIRSIVIQIIPLVTCFQSEYTLECFSNSKTITTLTSGLTRPVYDSRYACQRTMLCHIFMRKYRQKRMPQASIEE